jgi:hypothetical protein
MTAPQRRHGLRVSEGHAGPRGSRCSNVIRQPSEQLLGSCIGKKSGSHYKDEPASSYEGGFNMETILIVLLLLFLLGGGGWGYSWWRR